MHDEFFRFPHTPHLLWLGDEPPRADKVLSSHDAAEFLAHEVTVEEKVDGATSASRSTSEGHFARRTAAHGSHATRATRSFVRCSVGSICTGSRWSTIYRHVILFGEWGYAVHSVRYTHLPDWFLAFDV